MAIGIGVNWNSPFGPFRIDLAYDLLSQIGDLPYAVTKHAAVAVAEWLAITYGGSGITVSSTKITLSCACLMV